MSRVLVISDTQAPFHHPKTLEFLKWVYRKYKCNKVVHIGDEVDNKFLKYASVNDPHTAIEQHELAMKFMKQLYRAFPKAMVCNSNHVYDRLTRAAENANIPQFMIKDQKEYLDAPDTWEWRDSWEIDGVRYEHGHRFNGLRPHEKAVASNFQSTVIGHHAALGVTYFKIGGVQVFGMCVGAMTVNLNDARMGYGMKYSKIYAKEMPLGCGVVIDGKVGIIEPYEEK
jgi:predicted phosphodiesterase